MDFEKWFGGIFFIFIISCFIWLIVDSVNHPLICIDYRTVEIVGGCDKWAHCAVRFTDGSFGTVTEPVQGKLVCVQTGRKE